MVERTIIEERLAFWKDAHKKLQNAYIALIEGGAKSYMIDDRQLTRFDLPDLKKELEDCEEKIDELTAALGGKRPRKAVGIVPRDW